MARYTEAEKADAVAHYLEHGLAEAHKRTGVPKPTLHSWIKAAGHDPSAISERSADQTKAATAQHVQDQARTRALLQGELIEAARHHVRKSVEADRGGDAQHWMTAMAIGLDKYRLELGEATNRTEVVSPERRPEHDEEIAILYDLTERQAG